MVETNNDDIGDERSIMRKIDRTEAELKSIHQRLETIERNLKFRPMTMEERGAMEEVVQNLKDIIKVQEDSLKKLRGENRTSMMFAVILLIGTFVFYGIYSMMIQSSPPKKLEFDFDMK